MSKGPMTTDQDLERLTGLFKLLSDRTRLQILMLLAAGERNVSSLCEELVLPQPTVSHHLGLLRQHQVITSRREGKQVFYALHHKVRLAEVGMVSFGVDHLKVQISSTG